MSEVRQVYLSSELSLTVNTKLDRIRVSTEDATYVVAKWVREDGTFQYVVLFGDSTEKVKNDWA